MPSRRVYKLAPMFAVVFLVARVFTAAAAEDPARFQSVTNWYATFTRTLRSAGSGDGPSCHAEWSFSHSFEVKTELALLPFFGWTDIGKTNQSLRVQLNDKGTQTCGQTEPDVYTAGDSGTNRLTQWATLTVTATNYTLAPGYFVSYDGKVNGDPFPTSAIAWMIGSKGPIVEPLPESGMVLQGRRTYLIDQSNFGDPILTIATAALADSPQLLDGELVIEWTLTPVLEEVELVVDSPEYENWLPQGDLRDWNKPGNTIYIEARLQLTNGTPPLAARAKNFKFELLNVSAEQGVCMNRPHQEFADTKPDLRLLSASNQPPLVNLPLQIDGKTALTADGEYLVAMVGVSSFDFGASGELKVTATVNGNEIVAYYKKDPSKERQPLRLPKRQVGSFIADKWKKDNGVENLPDDDDSENEPVGDGHKGDGFTLYEEYRGFSENLKHIRLNPRQKDFFILDRIKTDDSSLGITTFQEQTGLNVRSEMRPEEFHAALGANGELFDTFVNFNHSNRPHRVDQHGIAVLRLSRTVGASYAGTNPMLEGGNLGVGGNPGRYKTVSIDPSGLTWSQIDLPDGSTRLNPQGPATIAHELGHTCTVYHHGDKNEGMVEWVQVDTEILETGQLIEVREEDNTPAIVLFGRNHTTKKYLGLVNGQHSGAELCFMRYDVAKVYKSTTEPNVRYISDPAEFVGLSLCTSAAGTGVNAASHRQQSRYGNATFGNCKGQVCVCDAYEGQHSR